MSKSLKVKKDKDKFVSFNVTSEKNMINEGYDEDNEGDNPFVKESSRGEMTPHDDEHKHVVNETKHLDFYNNPGKMRVFDEENQK